MTTATAGSSGARRQRINAAHGGRRPPRGGVCSGCRGGGAATVHRLLKNSVPWFRLTGLAATAEVLEPQDTDVARRGDGSASGTSQSQILGNTSMNLCTSILLTPRSNTCKLIPNMKAKQNARRVSYCQTRNSTRACRRSRVCIAVA